MPIYTDWTLLRYEDGAFVVEMTPPTPIGGWALEFQIVKRLGGTAPIITQTSVSGYNGVSGIEITNSGAGIMNITIPAAPFSGKDIGNYAWQLLRTTSGIRTVIGEGFRLIPS